VFALKVINHGIYIMLVFLPGLRPGS